MAIKTFRLTGLRTWIRIRFRWPGTPFLAKGSGDSAVCPARESSPVTTRAGDDSILLQRMRVLGWTEKCVWPGLSTVIARRSWGPKLMDAGFVGSIQSGSW